MLESKWKYATKVTRKLVRAIANGVHCRSLALARVRPLSRQLRFDIRLLLLLFFPHFYINIVVDTTWKAITNRTIIGQIESKRKINGEMWANTRIVGIDRLQLREAIFFFFGLSTDENEKQKSKMKKKLIGRLNSFAAVYELHIWHIGTHARSHTRIDGLAEKSFCSSCDKSFG